MPDVLVRGARVYTGGAAEPARLDVAISDGRISAIATDLPTGGGRVIDAGDALVVPGLVDAHAHLYWGVTTSGAWPDQVCLGGGVTTAVDAGSAGTDTYPGFEQLVAQRSLTRTLCFVNLSRIGMTGFQAAGELAESKYADPEGVATLLRERPDTVVGVKVRVSQSMVGGRSLPMLRLAREATAESGRPLMVHIGESVETLDEILDVLLPGDIVTHFQTPKANGLLDGEGRVIPAVRDARSRGILFDCGHGKSHFSFDVARRLLDQGFPPDTLSTDVSATSFADLQPGLLTVANKWLALGLPLIDALRASTSAPAAAIGRHDLGSLRVGGPADLAVLRLVDEQIEHRDARGQTLRADSYLAPQLTMLGGDVVWEPGTASRCQSDQREIGRRP